MSDIRLSSEGPRGPRGPAGPAGPAGNAGPTGPTGPAAASVAPLIASANVISNGGVLIEKGVTSVAHPGTGLFLITLTNPPANMANVAIIALPFAPSLGVSGQIVVNSVTNPNQFEIATFDATGTAADRSFSVVVYDLT